MKGRYVELFYESKIIKKNKILMLNPGVGPGLSVFNLPGDSNVQPRGRTTVLEKDFEVQ